MDLIGATAKPLVPQRAGRIYIYIYIYIYIKQHTIHEIEAMLDIVQAQIRKSYKQLEQVTNGFAYERKQIQTTGLAWEGLGGIISELSNELVTLHGSFL